MQDSWVGSLCQDNPLEKGMAPHSTIFAWKIPWTEESGGYSSWGHKELDTAELLTHKHIHKATLVNRCMKRCSTSLIIQEMKIKTTVRYHLTPVRIAIIKKITNNSYGEDVVKGNPYALLMGL